MLEELEDGSEGENSHDDNVDCYSEGCGGGLKTFGGGYSGSAASSSGEDCGVRGGGVGRAGSACLYCHNFSLREAHITYESSQLHSSSFL